MANEYDLGDLVRCTAAFTNTSGTAITPGTVVVKVKSPAGTVTTPSTTNPSTGNYYIDVDANKKGTWWVRWYSTGSGQAAAERSFTVATSKFP